MSTPPAKPSPFSSTPASSRPGSAPGSLFSRLGTRANYDYMPLHDSIVMFDLKDVGAKLFPLLEIPIPQKEDGTPNTDNNAFISVLEKDKALQEKLKALMLDSWKAFNLVGAVHLYDWREEVKVAATNRLQAAKVAPRYLRALDPMFVLNVLARARTYLLIPDAAVALDRPFLERVVMSDDPRMVSFARDTGSSDDLFIHPPVPDDIFDDEDDDK